MKAPVAVVEQVLPAEPGVRSPVCLAGKRAYPPAAGGGSGGYAEFVEASRQPKYPKPDALLVWVGGACSVRQFSLRATFEQGDGGYPKRSGAKGLSFRSRRPAAFA
jgi:hypothetical protein